MAPMIDDELSTLSIGDTRLDDRAKMMVACMADNPTASLPQAFGDKNVAKAAYRFLSNPAVEPEALYDALRESCAARLRDETGLVLVAHDTTAVSFNSHAAAEGLGPLGGPENTPGYGLFAHTSMALSEDSVPQGILQQQTWARDPLQTGQKHFRRERPFAEKESYRWLAGVRAAQAAIPDELTALHIADREADIFELLAALLGDGTHFLIRLSHDRVVSDDGDEGDPDDAEGRQRLRELLAAEPPAGIHSIEVRQHPEHKPRAVHLEIRFREVTLPVPDGALRRDPTLQPLTVTLIGATESDPPKGRKRVEWLLLTDMPVADFKAACAFVRHYSCRWRIERFHYTLKSGCRIEDSQLQHIDRIERLLALYCIVAWRLLWLTYCSRTRGDLPCTVAFLEDEWHVLWHYFRWQDPLPDQPPALREATRLLGQLGGFMGRKGDGEPGVKVLWRGLIKLQNMVLGYLLAQRKDVGKA